MQDPHRSSCVQEWVRTTAVDGDQYGRQNASMAPMRSHKYLHSRYVRDEYAGLSAGHRDTSAVLHFNFRGIRDISIRCRVASTVVVSCEFGGSLVRQRRTRPEGDDHVFGIRFRVSRVGDGLGEWEGKVRRRWLGFLPFLEDGTKVGEMSRRESCRRRHGAV